jgi:hypothetical protein
LAIQSRVLPPSPAFQNHGGPADKHFVTYRSELQVTSVGAVFLVAIGARLWTALLSQLAGDARCPGHCGTPYVNLFIGMVFLTAVSALAVAWTLYLHHCHREELTARFRFLSRLPLTILAGLVLAYWGFFAFAARG